TRPQPPARRRRRVLRPQPLPKIYALWPPEVPLVVLRVNVPSREGFVIMHAIVKAGSGGVALSGHFRQIGRPPLCLTRVVIIRNSQSGTHLAMTISLLFIRTIISGARIALFAAAALTLAACQTDGGSPAASDAPKAGVAAAQPDVATPKP